MLMHAYAYHINQLEYFLSRFLDGTTKIINIDEMKCVGCDKNILQLDQ